jgi:hypothetical protein
VTYGSRRAVYLYYDANTTGQSKGPSCRMLTYSHLDYTPVHFVEEQSRCQIFFNATVFNSIAARQAKKNIAENVPRFSLLSYRGFRFGKAVLFKSFG